MHKTHALLATLAIALMPLVFAHPGGLPGAPKTWCETTAADRNVHEYGPSTGFILFLGNDGSLDDCDLNGDPGWDRHFEHALGGAWLLSGDAGAQVCWGVPADHAWYPTVTVVDDALGLVPFEIYADYVYNAPPMDPNEPNCGDFEADVGVACPTSPCTMSWPPGLDGSYQVYVLTPTTGHVTTAPTVTECMDGIDNDGDGRTDHPADPACQDVWGRETPDATCGDLVDNDGDGLTDYPADPGCESPWDWSESPPVCSDGIDNDGDGKTDYPTDKGCFWSGDTDETNAQCNDELDNDGDGKVDYGQDWGCSSTFDDSESPEPVCGDGVDNDADGDVDWPEDNGCTNPWDTTEGPDQPECADRRDNDGDGQTDVADLDCVGPADDEEEPAACWNQADDDGDGLADWPADPDCADVNDASEG